MKKTVFGTSVRGASHIRSGTECQDSYKVKECDNGVVIMAVADGHGSKNCPFSKTGSEVAVDVFCSLMENYVLRFDSDRDTFLTYLNREGDTKVAQAIDKEWKNRIKKVHIDENRKVSTDDEENVSDRDIYAKYGTTLLGLVISEEYLFAFQIGDGDILFISSNSFEPVISGDKILGVETHSLSKDDAWKNAITIVRRFELKNHLPLMFLMSTDGFANSHIDSDSFSKTCKDYFDMVKQYGPVEIDNNLETWLSETSAMGCGDDITVLMAYYRERDLEHNPINDAAVLVEGHSSTALILYEEPKSAIDWYKMLQERLVEGE